MDPGRPDESRAVRELQSLLDISKALATEIDLDSLLGVIVDKATSVLEAERASIFVHHEESRTLVNQVSGQLDRGSVVVPVGVGIAGIVAETRQMLNVPDAYADPRFNPAFDRRTGFRTRSILTTPLLAHDGRLLGVLQVLNKRGDGAFGPADERVLRAFGAHAGVALERATLVGAALEKERIEESLRLASEIQMGMLPHRFPRGEGFDVYAAVRPARTVGGDFYDFLVEGGRLWFAVGDVSGKGVGAALFMAVTHTLLRAHARRPGATPDGVLAGVNRELAADNEQMMFATVFAGCLDPVSGELACSDGGHNPPYVVRAGGAVEAIAAPRGPALGVFPDASFAAARVSLGPGDRVFLYTDGVSEALDPGGAEFSVARLEERLRQAPRSSARELVGSLLADVDSFVSGGPQSDDITLMAVGLSAD